MQVRSLWTPGKQREPPPGKLAAITFSAWVRPTELGSYREIFRQESNHRLLFSLQNGGTVLSLGLNIGGYVECDAPIQPAQVLDGVWHHCAATFDGEFMRVYLDGHEIGLLPRAGPIALSSEVSAFIGSLGGTGEHFQGTLDDLRIYRTALSADESGGLHRSGAQALDRLAAELEGALKEIYVPAPSLAETLALSLQRMDTDGNRELIYEGDHHILHDLPLKPRLRPPVIEGHVAWPARNDPQPPKRGIIFSSDVDQGAPAVLRGKARFLQVFSIDHKTYTYWDKRPYLSTGPVVSAVQSVGEKRLLGTVSVEVDGSVSFHAPAGIPLHFQLLDEHQRALQTMRSFVNVMPGENRGCLGCHESHSRAVEVKGGSNALRNLPREITPPPWGEDTVRYPRYVQPVLDRYCGNCHQGDGEGRKALDLTERPSAPIFTEPYLTLIGRPTWGQPYRLPENPPPGLGMADCLLVEGRGTVDPKGYLTPSPMTVLSYRRRLIELASSGQHHDVKVDDLSLQRLIVWVDAMCPYQGDEDLRSEADPVFQGVDWLSIRPRIAPAPRIVRPGWVD